MPIIVLKDNYFWQTRAILTPLSIQTLSAAQTIKYCIRKSKICSIKESLRQDQNLSKVEVKTRNFPKIRKIIATDFQLCLLQLTAFTICFQMRRKGRVPPNCRVRVGKNHLNNQESRGRKKNWIQRSGSKLRLIKVQSSNILQEESSSRIQIETLKIFSLLRLNRTNLAVILAQIRFKFRRIRKVL